MVASMMLKNKQLYTNIDNVKVLAKSNYRRRIKGWKNFKSCFVTQVIYVCNSNVTIVIINLWANKLYVISHISKRIL